MKLTKDQNQALDTLLEHIEEGEMCCLQGYAGTGKTTLIGKLVECLLAKRTRVYACTPTHKAAQVLRSKMAGHLIDVSTIQSFLGLKLVRDNRGGYTLRASDDTSVPLSGVVIVDEASMVGSTLWKYIEHANTLTWVFVGDPAQLPPVNEDPSPVFDLPGPRLTSVVRQAQGNPIIDLATRIRHGNTQVSRVFKNGFGVVPTRNPKHFLERAIFNTKELGADARVLCYRNDTVAAYNERIREAIFGKDTPRFMEGDRLMACDAYFDENNVLQLQNSAEIDVVEAEEDEINLREYGRWKVWQITFVDDFGSTVTVPVLHEDERERYQKRVDELRDAAIARQRSWKLFYGLKEGFAKVEYAFAMTVHKAQGSTFNTAFVDWRDLASCRGSERQALMYVATTRPSQRLALRV